MKGIQLTTGETAFVDDDTYDYLSLYRWHLHKGMGGTYTRYAATRINGREVLMHRMILHLDRGNPLCGHHLDGNGLNNQGANLQAVSRATNQRNQVRRLAKNEYIGVHKHSTGWRACIHIGGKAIKFKTVKTPEEAAKMYQEARLRLHSEGQIQDNPDSP